MQTLVVDRSLLLRYGAVENSPLSPFQKILVSLYGRFPKLEHPFYSLVSPYQALANELDDKYVGPPI